MSIKIITTEDGSHSLFDDQLNETYHSTRGARGESLHVFIKEGLAYLLDKEPLTEVHILEVGLGTGLNAFLTAQFAKERKTKILLTSLEPYPIQPEIYQNLNFHRSQMEQELLLQIHDGDWERDLELTPHFSLHKSIARLEEFQSSAAFDLIYFDAFAPSKQPDVWSIENLRKCHAFLREGGVITTYCAQGQFKRNLSDAGFKVETLQGAMGKKEMVRGVKMR